MIGNSPLLKVSVDALLNGTIKIILARSFRKFNGDWSQNRWGFRMVHQFTSSLAEILSHRMEEIVIFCHKILIYIGLIYKKA
jgi:hypothetical protein